jgi:Tfp pilus assembly protein PilF
MLLGLCRHGLNDFIKAIEIDPNAAEAHYGCGGAYAALHDIENAIKEFRVAARMGLKEAQDHLNSKGIGW